MPRVNGLIKFVQVGVGLIVMGYLMISKFKSNQVKIENWKIKSIKNQPLTQSQQTTSTSTSTSNQCDPYSEQGSLYTSNDLHQSRYLIYNDMQSNLNNHQINQSDWIVPSYSHQLHQNNFKDLQWMKNKTILLIGDSIDRNLVIHFGRRALAGTKGTHRFYIPSDQIKVPVTKLESHQIGIAHVPELNLTIYNWFFMGVLVQEEVPFFHPREDLPQDFTSKLRKFYLPLLEKEGGLPFPDLVVFNTGFWDLEFLARSRAARYPLSTPSGEVTRFEAPRDSETDLGDGNALSLQELSVHRHRFRSFISTLQSSLRKIQVEKKVDKKIGYMYRSMQLGNATDRNAFSATRVRQIDASNLALVKQMGIRVLEWGKMTVGLDRQLTDPPIHYGIGSAQFIFGDMLLFYLKQHVLGEVEEWIGCTWIKERNDRIRLGLN